MNRISRNICLAGFFSIALSAGAKLEAFVSVQPATIEIVEPAGRKVSGAFLVKNPMDSDVEVEVAPEAFPGAVGMTAIPHGSWLRISYSKPFKLAPGEERKVKYRVKVPRGLSGEAMVMVYFNVNVIEPSLGGVSVKRRHGIPIYVISRGTERIDAEISKAFVKFASTMSASAMEFLINIENRGNAHLRPRGIVQIYRDGQRLEETALKSGFPVFPTAEHQYNAQSARTEWDAGQYQAKIVIYYGDEFGKNAQKEKTVDFKVNKDRKIDLLN